MTKTIGVHQPLPAELAATLGRLRDHSLSVFGQTDVQLEPLSVMRRESSEVMRARAVVGSQVRHLFIKIVRPRRADETLSQTRDRLRHDIQVTEHVRKRLQATPDLRAVETLFWDADLLSVVTEEAPGTPLDEFIATNAAWPGKAAQIAAVCTAMSRVGRWIATFQHSAPDAMAAPIDLMAMRSYIDVRLEKLTRIAQARFGSADRRAILDHIDRHAPAVPESDLTDVAVHGDITPSNVIVAPGCVTVLDFAMASRGNRYLDLARLYTQLEFYTVKPQFRRSVVERLQRAALAGFDSTLSPQHVLFELTAIQHVVCHYLSHARQPGSFPRSLYSQLQCRHHRRWLRRISTARPAESAAQPHAAPAR